MIALLSEFKFNDDDEALKILTVVKEVRAEQPNYRAPSGLDRNGAGTIPRVLPSLFYTSRLALRTRTRAIGPFQRPFPPWAGS